MPYYRLPSYDNLHGECWCGTKEEPCWGSAVGRYEDCAPDYSDCWDVVLCEGHVEIDYTLSDQPEDQGAEPKADED